MKVIQRKQNPWGWEENEESVYTKEESINEKAIGVGVKYLRKQKQHQANQNRRYGVYGSRDKEPTTPQQKFGWQSNNETADGSNSQASNGIFAKGGEVTTSQASETAGSSASSVSTTTASSAASSSASTAASSAGDAASASNPYTAVANIAYKTTKGAQEKATQKLVDDLQKEKIKELELEKVSKQLFKVAKDTVSNFFIGLFPQIYSLLSGVMLVIFSILPWVLPIITVAGLVGGIAAYALSSEQPIVEAAKAELEVYEDNIGGEKYKEWYGYDGNWCAMFVSYCANECGYIDDGTMPNSASVFIMSVWYKSEGLWQDALDGYEPKPGDIIFFQRLGSSHVGIVIDYDPENKIITTIEGNTGSSDTDPYHEGSRVKEKEYPLTYRTISGYGTPAYPMYDFDLEEIIEMILGEEDEDDE